MSNRNNPTSVSRAVEEIAAQRCDLRVFFDEEWSRLRAMIRELEEQAWDDVLSCDESHAELRPGLIEERPVSSRSVEHRSAESSGDIKTAAEDSVTASPDRLSQLAKQIERQLRAVHDEG